MHFISGTPTTTMSQVILVLVLGSSVCVWSNQLSDRENYEKMRMLYQGYKRLPSYGFGLGKRSFEENSYEDQQPSPFDATGVLEGPPGNGPNIGLLYPPQLSPGKRARIYGFGLGKRLLEYSGQNLERPVAPIYRQERRSKIYSFGLGKRQSHDVTAIEDYDQNLPLVDRRANQRQFAFGLGKRDVNANPAAPDAAAAAAANIKD